MPADCKSAGTERLTGTEDSRGQTLRPAELCRGHSRAGPEHGSEIFGAFEMKGDGDFLNGCGCPSEHFLGPVNAEIYEILGGRFVFGVSGQPVLFPQFRSYEKMSLSFRFACCGRRDGNIQHIRESGAASAIRVLLSDILPAFQFHIAGISEGYSGL